MADELKVIIHNRHDFEWANEHAARVKSSCKLYLQPEWSKAAQMLPLIVDFVMADPKWNVSLQTHKYMGIPWVIKDDDIDHSLFVFSKIL